MTDSRIITMLGWIVFITLAIGIYRHLSSYGLIFYESGPQMYSLPDAWGERYSKYDREGFENTPSKKAIGGVLDVAGEINPADANASPLLLGDVLEGTVNKGNLTAKTCYKTDFITNSNLLGNYIQRTNNFKHATPDNCSAPLTEMVNSFYKPISI